MILVATKPKDSRGSSSDEMMMNDLDEIIFGENSLGHSSSASGNDQKKQKSSKNNELIHL
ncbi:unknown protein [Arabidopsis thaliana]|jgi:hypothetical protein|uniref:F13E7.3 protein n=1 Tax=Arabidopsis thaliana TaxID=3702 RepID=Q9M8U3_ARATH|nr:unknown protein [Arabidopsis thaliana]AAM67248.1 unknown [Arabidopsis thaliana]